MYSNVITGVANALSTPQIALLGVVLTLVLYLSRERVSGVLALANPLNPPVRTLVLAGAAFLTGRVAAQSGLTIDIAIDMLGGVV